MKQPYKSNRRYGLTLYAAVFYFNVSAKVLPWRVLQKGSWCLFRFSDVADVIDECDKIGMVEPFPQFVAVFCIKQICKFHVCSPILYRDLDYSTGTGIILWAGSR